VAMGVFFVDLVAAAVGDELEVAHFAMLAASLWVNMNYCDGRG